MVLSEIILWIEGRTIFSYIVLQAFWSFAFRRYVHLALNFMYGVSHNSRCGLDLLFSSCEINTLNSPSSPTDLPRRISSFYVHVGLFLGSLSYFIALFTYSCVSMTLSKLCLLSIAASKHKSHLSWEVVFPPYFQLHSEILLLLLLLLTVSVV